MGQLAERAVVASSFAAYSHLGGGDERVPQGVRADALRDPRAAADPADDPGGAVPVQLRSVGGEEERPLRARSPIARSIT